MRVVAAIGQEDELRLKSALLVYESSRNGAAFVTRHSIQSRERGEHGTPTLGPGEPVTMTFVAELAKALGQELAPEVLPANVLARSAHLIAWWTPEQLRPFFYREESEMGALSGKVLPVPALVWRLSGNELHVRALRTNERPDATTKLRVAPFWNTSESGLVCQGTMARPDSSSVATLGQWVDAYFGSEFTHASGNRRLTRHPKGFVGLWSEVAHCVSEHRADPFWVHFPVDQLTDAKQTLQKFLIGSDDA